MNKAITNALNKNHNFQSNYTRAVFDLRDRVETAGEELDSALAAVIGRWPLGLNEVAEITAVANERYSK